MIQVNMMSELTDNFLNKLRAKYPQYNFVIGDENIEKAEILFGDYGADVMKKLPNLKFVQLFSSGVDKFVNQENIVNIKFASASGAYNTSIAEHMLAMHLALYRNLPFHRDAQNEALWQRGLAVPEIRLIKNSVVLVVGMGGIGGAYAQLVKSLGAYVIGVRRTDLRRPDYCDELYLSEELDNLLPRADLVAISAPLTSGTKHLFDRERLSKMKNSAVLMNVGRGIIVDTEAMCDALESGKLSGVALDVTYPEPLPENHRLWKNKNSLITPHCSGGRGKNLVDEGICEIFDDNLQRYLEGKQLVNEIDLTTHYRKLL